MILPFAFFISPLPENCGMRRNQSTYIPIGNDVKSKNDMSFELINCVQSLKHFHDKFINFDMYFYARNALLSRLSSHRL